MLVKSYQRNRRDSERRNPRGTIQVECRPGGHGLGKNIGERMLDFSETGARLVVRISFEIGEEVEVIVHRDCPGTPIKKLANVKWIVPTDDDHFCVGLQFQGRIPYSDIQRLARP